jgi:3-keto-5-aminohexanoate cleavage enzyme
MAEPVILELAVNGATPRHRNRHVPRTPAEITEVALAGIESGASIVHNHNDEPMFTADGVHAVEPYLAAWRPVLERDPDALLYPTRAAGARGIPVARRWAHVEELARRGMGGMTLVDPGSVNLGLTSAGAVAADAAAGRLGRGSRVRPGYDRAGSPDPRRPVGRRDPPRPSVADNDHVFPEQSRHIRSNFSTFA